MRRVALAFTAAASVLVSMFTALPAQAVQSPQGSLVSEAPVDFTPGVDDGAVRAITEVRGAVINGAPAQDVMVIGGTFTSATPHGGASESHPYVLAFNATTGAVIESFAPALDGPVDALVAAPDGKSVYVGGEFVNVNGVKAKSLVRLNIATGATVTSFRTVVMNGNVLDLKLSGSHLWVGGNFSKFATFDQPALATVDATTGKYDPYDQVPFAGTQRGGTQGGTTAIQKFDITPDGSRLLVIGNFSSVGGVTHHQAAMLDLGPTGATVSDWATSFYDVNCANAFQSYLRDLDISPDGTYAVVSTTGAYGGTTSPCDETSRWEMTAHGTGLTPTWTNYTGGDTTYAVAATGTAVYVGGHFRWSNNAFAADRAGAGAVAREGIAALDPKNGLPLGWDPGRARGVGVFDMLATPEGLWVGSDTDRIGGWGIHPKIAFFPLPGGAAVPSTDTPQLPAQAYLAGNTAGTNSNVLYRVNAAGPALPSLDAGPDWAADNGTTNPLRTTGSNVATYSPSATLNASVPAGTPSAIFDSERWAPNDSPSMQWNFPVPAGTHVGVRLYFANRCSCTSGVGQRKFNVSIDGVPKLTSFDIVADAGGSNVGEMKSFDITSDGTVNINFTHVLENPLVNGIELVNEDTVLTGSPNDMVTRAFTGTSTGATSTVPSSISWAQARGAFYINGTLYTGWSDGNLYARPFDGTSFGTPVSVNGMDQIAVLSAFHTDVQSITSMFFDSAQNRIYYTLTGSSTLYWRGFTPSTHVVGALRYNATNTSTVNFANATAMFLSGGSLYVGERTTGNLLRVSFSRGVVSGTATAVSGPSIDGASWLARAAFLAPTPGAPNVKPTAAFTSSCLAAQCTFDAGTSTDPDGSITSYTWDFGDGTEAASSAPQHTYGAGGSYQVTLTVTDNSGASDTITKTVSTTSTNKPPTAAFTSSCAALDCTFDGTGSADPDGTIDSYEWDFGDGTTSQDVSPEHTFASAGSYSVTLKVIDDQNATDTESQQVTVGSTAAHIAFVGSDEAVAYAKKISVTVPAAVTADDGMVLIATAASPTTTLTPPAGWTAVDSETTSSLQTQVWQQVATDASAGSTVSVTLPTAVKTTLVLAAYSGTNTTAPVQQDALASETVNRAAHTTPRLTTSLSGAWLLSYWSDVSSSTTSWTAPSGQPVRATVAGTGGGHVSTLLTDLGGALTVGSVGGYTATADASSSKAALGTLVLAPAGIAAPNQPPAAAFTSSCTTLSCDFTNTSTDADGSVTSSSWTFGDGSAPSTQTSPTHAYAAPGIYSVSLTVTDDQGATDTVTQQVTVSNATSHVAFVGSATAAANAAKATVTVPSAVSAGNAMVLIASSANATTSLSAPAGWTKVGSSPAGSANQTVVWQQVADSSSAGSTVTVTQGTMAKVTVTLAAYSGTQGTAPVVASAFAAESTTTATHTTPTLSTSASGAWLLSYWSDVSTDTASWTTQAGQTNRATVIGTGGGHVSSVLSDLGGPLSVGTVGGYTATSNAASSKASMVTLVLASE